AQKAVRPSVGDQARRDLPGPEQRLLQDRLDVDHLRERAQAVAHPWLGAAHPAAERAGIAADDRRKVGVEVHQATNHQIRAAITSTRIIRTVNHGKRDARLRGILGASSRTDLANEAMAMSVVLEGASSELSFGDGSGIEGAAGCARASDAFPCWGKV